MLDLAQWFVTTNGPDANSGVRRKEAFLSCVRLDGSLRRDERERVLKQFRSPSGPPILFASLKTCGVGINLTCASCVIMLDLWWNPAVEAQALDRVHRLGQSQAVRVWRLTVTGTVEEKLLAMQVRGCSRLHSSREVELSFFPIAVSTWLLVYPSSCLQTPFIRMTPTLLPPFCFLLELLPGPQARLGVRGAGRRGRGRRANGWGEALGRPTHRLLPMILFLGC